MLRGEADGGGHVPHDGSAGRPDAPLSRRNPGKAHTAPGATTAGACRASPAARTVGSPVGPDVPTLPPHQSPHRPAVLLAAWLGAAAHALATAPGINGDIAFVRGGDLWAVAPDATGARPLTVGPEIDCVARAGPRTAARSPSTAPASPAGC